MKGKVAVSIFAAAFALLLPLFAAKSTQRWDSAEKQAKNSLSDAPEEVQEKETDFETNYNFDFDLYTALEDSTVDVLMGDKTVTMDLEEYLLGVVAGEMPPTFEEDALKAQAVAARTYTLYKLLVSPSTNHEADVCTDPTCCKAYSDETTLREKWGDEYDANMAKIASAVWRTSGEYMIYNNEPVLAVFHSSSSGATENSENVWNQGLPYLVSVSSPETSDEVKNYITTTNITHEDFCDTFRAQYPDADFSSEPSGWICDIVRSDSGRINTVTIGGVTVKGTELRSVFSLRSTAVEIEVTDTDIVFTVSGYGHGVGMSQYGANIMAKEGKTYRDILSWYYTGVGFAKISEAF